jgi:hypothetical protein
MTLYIVIPALAVAFIAGYVVCGLLRRDAYVLGYIAGTKDGSTDTLHRELRAHFAGYEARKREETMR